MSLVNSAAVPSWLSIGRSRVVRIGASLAISTLLLCLAFRAIDVDKLLPLLRSSSRGWVAAAVALYWVELVFRIQRWRLLVQPIKPLRFGQIADAFLVGYAANNVMPARLGELVRADYIGRRHGVSRFSAVSTIVIERSFDLLVVTLCAGLGALLLLRSRASLPWSLIGGVSAAAVVVMLAFALMFALSSRRAHALADRFQRLRRPLLALSEGLESLRRPRLLAAVVALSALAWVFNALATGALLLAVGIAPHVTILLLVIGVSGFAVALPSAPSGVGTLQFAFVSVTGALAHDPTGGFAAALFMQIFLLGSVTAAGAVIYAVSGLTASRKTRG